MFYVYVLQCKDSQNYTGCTRDLQERMAWHRSGKVSSTACRLPVELIYYEACLDKKDAFKREKYLTTTYGKRFIRSRCKNYLTGSRNPVE